MLRLTDTSRAAWAESGFRFCNDSLISRSRPVSIAALLLGVSRLTALGEEVAELVEADRDIASGLGGVRVPLLQRFGQLEAARVVAQGLFGVTRLTALGEEVAELLEADRNIASGLGGVRVPLQQRFPDFVASPCSVRSALLGVSMLAPQDQQVAKLTTGDGHFRWLSGFVLSRGEEPFRQFERTLRII